MIDLIPEFLSGMAGYVDDNREILPIEVII